MSVTEPTRRRVPVITISSIASAPFSLVCAEAYCGKHAATTNSADNRLN